jgi:hypothetical protein
MYSAILLALLGDAGPRPADPILDWNEVTLETIRAEKTPPPMAARNLAMVHAAIYDAVNSIARTHTSFLVNAHPPAEISVETAAAVAAHRVLLGLYPKQAKRFDAALRRSLLDLPDGPDKDEGMSLGKFVAEQMLEWRSKDGSSRKVTVEQVEAPGAWKPTPPNYQAALLPQWPSVVPFTLPDLKRFRPAPPPALTSAEYTASYREVKSLGSFESSARTADQTEIAKFWADGAGTVTPPGHWNRIAQNVARSRRTTLTENARLFALLNLGMADCGIACWDCKYRFNLWRPVHAIREGDRDGNPDTEADANWKPLLETPPFPTYTSGHSSFSGCAATVLASVFGDKQGFSSTSDGLPGVTRSFTSFSSAAAEAGKSRIYGGIHWEFDNSAGLDSGRKIGQFITTHWLLPR